MPERNEKPVVLVVDDDPTYRRFMRGCLEFAGYRAIAESSGRFAHRRLADTRIDAIVTDLVMPEVDGLELIALTRASHPHVPIIAVSGGDDGGHYLEDARLLGAAAAIEKPCTCTALIETVAAVLQAAVKLPGRGPAAAAVPDRFGPALALASR